MASSHQSIQSVRGMHDLTPDQSSAWQFLQRTYQELIESYGYVYIQTPIVENIQLFEKTIGAESDIVLGEMYTFADKGGASLCLRPEGTAAVVRMALEHNLIYRRLQKYYYGGAMFRRERPQKGRYRQFHQLGAEVFGDDSHWADVELLMITRDLLNRLGIEQVSLEINSLGDQQEMESYHKTLFDYFSAYESELDPTDHNRLHNSPLRILDSKNPKLTELIANAPTIDRHYGAQSRTRFEQLCQALDDHAINYSVNKLLVRGLAYYSQTVFEWVDSTVAQGQNTLIAGGRYDRLPEHIGAAQTVPACGFAAGVERLLAVSQPSAQEQTVRLHLLGDGQQACAEMIRTAGRLRQQFSCEIMVDSSSRSLSAKIKDSGHRKPDILMVMGEREHERQSVLLSFPSPLLSSTDDQRILLKLTSLHTWLRDNLPSSAQAVRSAV